MPIMTYRTVEVLFITGTIEAVIPQLVYKDAHHQWGGGISCAAVLAGFCVQRAALKNKLSTVGFLLITRILVCL